MLEKAIQKIVALAENKTYEIDGQTYSDHALVHIPKKYDSPGLFELAGLDGIVKVVKTEIGRLNAPLIVRVTSPTYVDVFTTYREDMHRDRAYMARAEVPGFADGYCDHMETIIRLRSRFAANDGQGYLLKLLSRMNMEQDATTTDNGVTQTVTARQGISLNQLEVVKPIVKLRPYRTFLEVEQPESEFLLRIDDKGRVGLFEADGGAWKLQAKQNVLAYIEANLADEVAAGRVVVTM